MCGKHAVVVLALVERENAHFQALVDLFLSLQSGLYFTLPSILCLALSVRPGNSLLLKRTLPSLFLILLTLLEGLDRGALLLGNLSQSGSFLLGMLAKLGLLILFFFTRQFIHQLIEPFVGNYGFFLLDYRLVLLCYLIPEIIDTLVVAVFAYVMSDSHEFNVGDSFGTRIKMVQKLIIFVVEVGAIFKYTDAFHSSNEPF